MMWTVGHLSVCVSCLLVVSDVRVGCLPAAADRQRVPELRRAEADRHRVPERTLGDADNSDVRIQGSPKK